MPQENLFNLHNYNLCFFLIFLGFDYCYLNLNFWPEYEYLSLDHPSFFLVDVMAKIVFLQKLEQSFILTDLKFFLQLKELLKHLLSSISRRSTTLRFSYLTIYLTIVLISIFSVARKISYWILSICSFWIF